MISKTPKAQTMATRARRDWTLPAAVAVSVLLLLLAPIWAPLLLRRMSFFRVRHVEVVGARYVRPRDILDRLKVDTQASVWDPTGPLEQRIATHPLVRAVYLHRKLPGTLVVRLAEYTPVALVPSPAGLRAYDVRGVPLPIDPTTADVDVPILVQLDKRLLTLLAAARNQVPEMYRRISEVRREGEGGREVAIVLDSLLVRTLSDVTLHRLRDLELVERDLARRQRRAIELDLRYRDQVIARLP